jgi:hypothetical protein
MADLTPEAVEALRQIGRTVDLITRSAPPPREYDHPYEPTGGPCARCGEHHGPVT